jgi:hypothetical protein
LTRPVGIDTFISLSLAKKTQNSNLDLLEITPQSQPIWNF